MNYVTKSKRVVRQANDQLVVVRQSRRLSGSLSVNMKLAVEVTYAESRVSSPVSVV